MVVRFKKEWSCLCQEEYRNISYPLVWEIQTSYQDSGLEKLGVVETNWKKQEMCFDVYKEVMKLVGDPSLSCSKIFPRAMSKL